VGEIGDRLYAFRALRVEKNPSAVGRAYDMVHELERPKMRQPPNVGIFVKLDSMLDNT
jgi:hypothetical protein